ncbi:MAG TPA: hypothetical protein VMV43_13455 [Candidatus Nanopelagicaceae bacterium]|jgi:hypothetical protein|nr:hypothetical protein [Candidatus Nanopelagicaceae bacterium]
MSYKWINKNLEKTYGFNIERINSDDNRFHAIYFLDNITGSLLLSKKYTRNTKFSSHDDLISGFLNALNLFMSEIKPESMNDEIQEVNFKESRILYERRGRLSVIGISKKTNLQVERVILHQIMEDFYYKFESAIRNFNGNIDPSILQYKKRLENMNLNTFFKFDVQL